MKKILIVDDDAAYRGILKKKLTDAGYQTMESVNGEDALVYVKENATSIDLILLDITMPVMDGLTCYYKMKQSFAVAVPIIILTNSTISAYPSDIKDYMVKTDTTLDQLVEKINSYFS
jgi:CheY-like chemotaxis protein